MLEALLGALHKALLRELLLVEVVRVVKDENKIPENIIIQKI
jgi:hypothetical protein